MMKYHLASILYGITSLVMFIFCFTDHSAPLDIAYHDIYFVISKSHIWLILAGAFLLFTGVSLTLEHLKKPIGKVLFIIHFLTSLLSFVFLFYAFQPEPLPIHHIDYSVWKDFTPVQKNEYEIPVGYLVLRFVIASQMVFIAAVFLAILKKKKNTDF
jgi:heme/copper-type cytochrome/quinol oxidase subunit 1